MPNLLSHDTLKNWNSAASLSSRFTVLEENEGENACLTRSSRVEQPLSQLHGLVTYSPPAKKSGRVITLLIPRKLRKQSFKKSNVNSFKESEKRIKGGRHFKDRTIYEGQIPKLRFLSLPKINSKGNMKEKGEVYWSKKEQQEKLKCEVEVKEVHRLARNSCFKNSENLYIFANWLRKIPLFSLISIYLILTGVKCFPMYFLNNLFLLSQIVY